MTFSRADPDENFPLLRFVSAAGRWQVGSVPLLYGVRVRAGVTGEQLLSLDYCAGADPLFQVRLLECILNILSALPEEVSSPEVMALMPLYKAKPISDDPCWERLQRMEERVLERLATSKP